MTNYLSHNETILAPRNTLALEGVLFQRLLSKLDATNSKGKPSAARIFRRLSYAHERIGVHVESEGHNERTLTVATRNLSQGGASILHSSFMYPGTTLTIELIDNKNKVHPQHGTVTRCEHRGGRVHEIGIKFDDEIILREFLDPNPENLLHSREKIDAQHMDVKLLVLSDENEFSQLLRQYMLPTNIRYKFAKSQDEALELAEKFDMILCKLNTVTMQTPETIRMLRESGFQNPIILVGRPTSQVDTHVVGACGADMFLPWPCDEQTMLCSIGEYVFNSWTTESLENLRSAISPETRAVLCVELAKIGVTLDQHVRTNNQDGAYTCCARIRMLAPLLNLVALKSAIENLTERVSVEDSLENLAEELSEISSFCKGISKKAA